MWKFANGNQKVLVQNAGNCPAWPPLRAGNVTQSNANCNRIQLSAICVHIFVKKSAGLGVVNYYSKHFSFIAHDFTVTSFVAETAGVNSEFSTRHNASILINSYGESLYYYYIYYAFILLNGFNG